MVFSVMMANSIEKGEKKRKVFQSRIFNIAIAGVKKEVKKDQDLQKQCQLESESQNSNCSKNISNEQLCSEKLLLSNNKHDGHDKQTSSSKQICDENDDSPNIIKRISRPSKSHNWSKDSNDYSKNNGSNQLIRKSYETPDKPKSNFSNSDYKITSDIKTFEHRNISSNDIYYEKFHDKTENDMQKPRHAISCNISTDFNSHMNTQYNLHKERSYNSKSDFVKYDSYNLSQNFSEEMNYKQITNFQKPHFPKYNEQNKSYSSQRYDSHNNSYTKKHYYEHQDKVKPNCWLTNSNIQMPDKKENEFCDDELEFEDHFDSNTIEMEHKRSCLVLDETLKHNKEKNIKITITSLIPDSVPKTSPLSSPLPSSVSNSQISSPLSASISSAQVSSISNISPELFIPNISPVSITSSNLPLNSLSPNVYDNSDLTNNLEIFNFSKNSFIPPPVSNEIYSNEEKNETSLQSNESESTENSYADEAYFSLPDSDHLKGISDFISKVVKERSISKSSVWKVIADLNRLFKNYFEGNVIEDYGSYETDLAITTSDINLSIEANVPIKNSHMYEIHKLLSYKLEGYHVQFEEGISAHKSKIIFTHPDTGINCELAYLGKNKANFHKMGKFLKEMCLRDPRVKSLIIAVKVWAEHLNINEVEDGKLHPIGFALLVIHLLQHCDKPILPVYSFENEGVESLPHNESSIGALWLEFLRYYAYIFNWQENMITVTSKDNVLKKTKKWENYWLAIEDPFTGKNIAESVINKDVADYIKSCFKQSYDYFWNGPKNIPYFDQKESESSAEYSSSQLGFSFNDCIVEPEENICEMCDEMNDVCNDCKKKIYVQPMSSVPKMTDDFLKIVREAILTVYDKYILSEAEIKERKDFVKNLEYHICKRYPDARMRLIGSSANGFGFKKSDLDICMTFKSEKKLDPFSVLRQLRYLLRKDANFSNVIAIFNAQIPIIKFRYEPLSLCGDISLDNVLAVHNSELLYTYSKIDERCKILGCILKLIAKKALIAEVTEKALSSYSYIIMAIHFLQQTNPPVLPVLQDSQFRKNFELGDIVDDCNVWFCRDLNYIKKVFTTENETPVEKLFLELLDYYCSFDCNQVITIRQKEILYLSEKMRSARLFNIQDPFIETKNLGCVVSPTKAQETKSVLDRARRLFRTPKKDLHVDFENYFFSIMNLTGRFQKEALCEFCGKFGHDKKNCNHLFPFPKKFPFRRRYFKYPPRQRQYVNQNTTFLKQMNTQSYVETF